MATTLLKRFVCPTCGAPSAMAPDTPFVQCGSCGTVGDFDLGVARRHPDWPRHEALLHELYARHGAAFAAARAAGDRDTWIRIYAEIVRALIDRCPAVYPARIGDPAYRARFVEFQTHHGANLAFEPALVAHGGVVAERTRAIARDPSGWRAASLWPAFEEALAYFDAQDRHAARRPPPDDFAPGWLRRMGTSLIAQEWLPRLAPDEQLELVARLGVGRAYVVPWAATVSHCGGCGEDLDPAAGARCVACARELDVARGGFACATCGVTIHVVIGVERAVCPYCAAELRESRMGLEAREQSRQLFRFLDGELALAEQAARARAVSIDVLDGPVVRRGRPWRMVTLRAQFAAGPPRAFFENTDVDGAPSHRDLDAWLEVAARDRGVPHRRLEYREHPRCNVVPADVAEIERRLADAAPGAPAVARAHGPAGWALEAEVAGAIVRVVLDEEGRGAALYARWRG